MKVHAVLDEIRERPGTGEVIPVIDPATEEQLTEVKDCGPEAVDDAVARAKASFESGVWRDLPGSERAKVLWRVGELIDQHAAELAELESLNAGMTPLQAQGTVAVGAEFFRYYAGWCTKIEGIAADVHTGGLTGIDVRQHVYTLKEPYGVVGLIFPWNGPIFNFCCKVAPSLAAGCSSVVKPAEETPLTAVILERILAEAGVPDGVANVLIGYGHTAGAAITAHPDVEKVAFTGSTEVGREIVHAAGASNLKKVTLELGGKSPVLIFDDANLEAAIPMAAFGTFIHSGQACVCGSRIFAQRGVYQQVVEGIAKIADTLQLGGPKDEGAMIGPLISQKQLTRVMGYLDQGKSDGVEVVTGGHRLDRKGYFVRPTVLTNVATTSRLFQEEIFGPVVAILPFDDEDEAVALANDSTYGLAATAWTRDLGRAHRLAKRLQAGTVGLNCQMQFDHSMPFGGYKQSGWGYESGRAGLETYLQTKIVWAQL
ncbi:aldehyde dehydrogenase family protein [Mycobacterium heckeshornense]|uniref:Putative succinate-semialdehyde dehydrogenase [NADP(+)] 2 n=1 Tax=Mycobacterium heckeshornense TaxID=110505 RepID=A0A2I3EX31_9MYCO|nr:aldehyde dehydrogenase family protein [Mycobacterium heckeshornense]KMV23563.1 betaine-aldehyde dehydrogenase [Mycobacterium heckeshornense]MCV7033030.1 aldehyde dehydrogenase family protein [Mycobacterium heckeshornense]BCO38117.1 phenylacetaldehyde dehydrogenase [Mycobacterium heckeshornense]BCQ10973.1 aldehyde dehydrogenase [Mycobacterium heckeshornense]